MKSYHFSLGNSWPGPIGYCARINAQARERVLFRGKARRTQGGVAMKITKWVRSGELNSADADTVADVQAQCGRLLDKSCAHEIVGEVLFLGADGKWYTVTVEAEISEANPDWVQEMLEEVD